MEINAKDAQTQFSQLLRRVAAGEEIVIEQSGKPIARLVPIQQTKARHLGTDAGIFTVPDDFDAPLPADIQTAFEQ